MRKPIIEINDAWKTYEMGSAGELDVLKKINLKIYTGEFISISGPSGSGKSTMMNIVGALDTPSDGHIYLEGKDIAKMTESELATMRGRIIGFVFQQFNLIPTLTALQNVMLPMDFINTPSTDAKKRAIELLEKLELGDRLYHKPKELSGGQQQRVAIARSLVNNPDIVLADEPTGNLDSKTGRFVMEFLSELHRKQGKTIILVTHDSNLIKYAHRVVSLRDGFIVNDTGDKK